MATSTQRTDTGFFIAVVMVVAIGLVWASASYRTTTPATSGPSQSGREAVSAQSKIPEIAWSGELVLVRDDRIVGVATDGTERGIYSAPTGRSISAATELASGHGLVALGGSESSVVDVDLRSGDAVTRTDLPDVQLTSVRPTTGEAARVTFANDERNFGSTVTLVDRASTRSLYQAKGVTVTAIAWRADGDALALGTQTGVIVVPLTTGDAATFDLDTPVRSLTWHGGSVLAVTEKDGAVEVNPAGNPVIATRSAGFGDVGRDFYRVAPDRYVWLRTVSESGTVVTTTEDSSRYRANETQPIEVTSASRILGVLAP